MTKQLKADLCLLAVMVFWGFSFLVATLALEHLEPLTLNAWRFFVAFATAALLAPQKLRSVSGQTLKYSIILGIILAVMLLTITYGLRHTTLANASFLCGLTVVFTPIIGCCIYRKSPGAKLVAITGMCATGIALLTLTENLSIDYNNLPGDTLSILCSIIYAIYLLLTEKVVTYPKVDAYQLGVLQLGVTWLVCMGVAFIMEEPIAPPTLAIWGGIFFLGVLCTGAAFIVQTVALRYTTASHVGVISCFETVFAGLVAYSLGSEELTIQAFVGASLIILALFMLEIDFGQLIKKKNIRTV